MYLLYVWKWLIMMLLPVKLLFGKSPKNPESWISDTMDKLKSVKNDKRKFAGNRPAYSKMEKQILNMHLVVGDLIAYWLGVSSSIISMLYCWTLTTRMKAMLSMVRNELDNCTWINTTHNSKIRLQVDCIIYYMLMANKRSDLDQAHAWHTQASKMRWLSKSIRDYTTASQPILMEMVNTD